VPTGPDSEGTGARVGPQVSVREVLEHPGLRDLIALQAGEAGLDRRLSHPRVQKSGLVLALHARGVVPSRVQVLGETELSYLESLPPEVREERVAFMFALQLSLVVLTRGVEPPPELLEHAHRTGTPLAVSGLRSSVTINRLHGVLDRLLAPRARVHGVLVVVHGIGMLLTGKSGIGKSECALFLVERGHRLVADDQVELTQLPDATLVGAPLPLLKHHLEIRGLGILNIRDLFGATAVRDEARLDVVVELCPFRDDEPYERLGLDDQSIELLETKVAKLRIPVRPGRDMAVILEISARNQLLKREGLHGAKRFAERLDRELLGRNKG
jgi:HPr kinase/phosphorylase